MWTPSTAGHTRVDCRAGGGQGGADGGQVVADQGGQEAGGAKTAMRRPDAGYGLDARLIVEQDACRRH